MKYLVTGAAGFVGSHVVDALITRGDRVVGLDNMNDYYPVKRKLANLNEIHQHASANNLFKFVEGDVRDRDLLRQLSQESDFHAIVHLAAMAGVRASIKEPALYYSVNVDGTLALLDASVEMRTRTGTNPNFVFASTSSVYGATQVLPFQESDPCVTPLVPYSASKRAAELLGYSYHHLYEINFTALRFFTVYGPRGRPDMMAYKIADSIRSGKQVPLYNGGQMFRDWTFVEDIVAGVVRAADTPLGYEVINLGRGEPLLLAEFVKIVEQCIGGRAEVLNQPMPTGDVPSTHADISRAYALLDYEPRVSIEEGVARFVEWHLRNA